MNAPMNKSLMRKRASRLAASQALYSQALTNSILPPEKLIGEVLQSWADSKTNKMDDVPYNTQPETALATKLVITARAETARIEPAIEAIILPQWKKSRMSLPLLSVLRTCAAEAIMSPSKSRGMLVEEYTEVASQLIGDDELAYAHKGFNLLLDALHTPST
jgi:transcription termination factor NusB